MHYKYKVCSKTKIDCIGYRCKVCSKTKTDFMHNTCNVCSKQTTDFTRYTCKTHSNRNNICALKTTTSLTVCDFRHKTQLLHTGLKKRSKTTIKDNNLRRKEGKQTKRLKDEAVLMCTLLPFPSEYNTSASTSDLTTAAVVRASLPGIFSPAAPKRVHLPQPILAQCQHFVMEIILLARRFDWGVYFGISL